MQLEQGSPANAVRGRTWLQVNGQNYLGFNYNKGGERKSSIYRLTWCDGKWIKLSFGKYEQKATWFEIELMVADIETFVIIWRVLDQE